MSGRWLIFLGCGFAAFASVAAPASLRRSPAGWTVGRHELLDSSRRAMAASAACFTIAAGLLWYALFTRDFSLAYVAETTSRATQPWYTLSAFWSGMDGSLLLWCWIAATFSAVFAARPSARSWLPWALPVLGVTVVFFGLVTAIGENPFRQLDATLADGRGLNPLLQSPGMMIHPPLLYAGLVGLTVPFAVAVAALASGRTGGDWLRTVRTWALVPWLALGAGMVIGGAWAYTELGWGGYWGWDPVENAALLPWLALTAFLHSATIQERRGMLKVWNLFLVVLAADLAVFGTFLTRSGLLSSVHTFAESPVGRWFFLFLALQTAAGAVLIIWRLPSLRSDNRLDAPLSKESLFLVNNLLFVAAAFVILWGTVLPLLTEAATGTRLSVGPPFFNRVMSPLGALLMLLAAVGPVVPWRRGSARAVAHRMRLPAAVSAVGGTAAGALSRNALFGLLCALAALAAASGVQELVRGAGRPGAGRSWRNLARNPRRYGGYFVHIGVAVMFVGFAGSLMRAQTEVSVRVGDRFAFAGYDFHYRDLQAHRAPDKDVNLAVLDVHRGGRRVATLRPQLNIHANFDQPQSEIAIRTTPAADLYVILAGTLDDEDRSVFRIHHNPLVMWVWVGTLLSVLGGLFALLARRRRDPYAGRAAQAPVRAAAEPAGAGRWT
ncbi:MAG TPA: heme lyase CcmF/NrfE family subunit [Actinomycetota bacterium]|nr:heme lyase CcmF/NrfE family subunit [Actinomycetota bacterium]